MPRGKNAAKTTPSPSLERRVALHPLFCARELPRIIVEMAGRLNAPLDLGAAKKTSVVRRSPQPARLVEELVAGDLHLSIETDAEPAAEATRHSWLNERATFRVEGLPHKARLLGEFTPFFGDDSVVSTLLVVAPDAIALETTAAAWEESVARLGPACMRLSAVGLLRFLRQRLGDSYDGTSVRLLVDGDEPLLRRDAMGQVDVELGIFEPGDIRCQRVNLVPPGARARDSGAVLCYLEAWIDAVHARLALRSTRSEVLPEALVFCDVLDVPPEPSFAAYRALFTDRLGA